MRILTLIPIILFCFKLNAQSLVIGNDDIKTIVFANIPNHLKIGFDVTDISNIQVKTDNGVVKRINNEIIWKPIKKSDTSTLQFFNGNNSDIDAFTVKRFKVCNLGVPELLFPKGIDESGTLDIIKMDSLQFNMKSRLTFCYPFIMKNSDLNGYCKIQSFEILYSDSFTKTKKVFHCEKNWISKEFKDFFKLNARVHSTVVRFQNIMATIGWISNNPISILNSEYENTQNLEFRINR